MRTTALLFALCLTSCAYQAQAPDLTTDQALAACGQEPPESDRDAWFSYGDCSGYYGPIDAAE